MSASSESSATEYLHIALLELRSTWQHCQAPRLKASVGGEKSTSSLFVARHALERYSCLVDGSAVGCDCLPLGRDKRQGQQAPDTRQPRSDLTIQPKQAAHRRSGSSRYPASRAIPLASHWIMKRPSSRRRIVEFFVPMAATGRVILRLCDRMAKLIRTGNDMTRDNIIADSAATCSTLRGCTR
jgi:hypothetical protein